MNKRQQLLSRIKLSIIKNCKAKEEEYYGDVISIYDNIDKYLDELDNIYDKISLAQWANNMSKVNELVSSLELNNQENKKYLELKQKNIDIDETINFEILSPKYAFLNNMLDMITTDSLIQEQILSLSDEMLEVFKSLYNRLEEISSYNVPYIANILTKIGYVTPKTNWQNRNHYYDKLNQELENLIKSGKKLNTDEIDNLLFIYNNSVNLNINTIEELRSLKTNNSKFQLSIDEIIEEERQKEDKDIDNIKSALLLKSYGISFNKACDILKKYKLTNLEVTEENKDLFDMYKAIARIIQEENPDLLINIYDLFSKEVNLEPNFMRITTFENDLRKEFAKSLNREVFKIDNQEFTIIDDVKVYDAGTDFKMIVTALGACQSDFQNQENYNTYWNSPHIRSHGNCCSLIGNNNLSMAHVKNVILGFSTMNENMLLLSGNRDLNSTPNSRNFNISENNRGNIFTSGDDLLDNTRGDYNELVYERRDLSNNPKFYKKNPDYIVFIEEYENIDEYINYYQEHGQLENVNYLLNQKEEQERMWQETIKASKDFNVPIVKINREKCAKSEIKKIENMVTEFEKTKNPELIYKIIIQFHNNRFGNKDYHHLISSKYFDKEKMDSFLERINNTIIDTDDLKTRNKLLTTYKNTITTEQSKVDYYRYIADTKNLSVIDFNKMFKIIDEISKLDNYSNNPTTLKKGK